jgi:DegV family protein with EDD domain
MPKECSEICVIGDSSMSLAYDIAVKEGIERLENYVHVHNRMVRDSDLNREELFRRMRDKYVYKTAQASPEDVKLFLENMLVTSGHLVYPAVGRAYTGTQELVRKLAESPAFKGRVTVLDTHAASGQQGLICLAAARYARRTTDLQEIAHYINNQIATCREYLVIDNLKYLSRTGRIGRIKAAFAGALSVKPIVGHGQDGASTHTKTRSHEAAVTDIGERVMNHPGQGQLLVMVEYTDNRQWADRVLDHLKTVLPPDAELISSPLSSTSAVHMGPGTWGVAVTRVETTTAPGGAP